MVGSLTQIVYECGCEINTWIPAQTVLKRHLLSAISFVFWVLFISIICAHMLEQSDVLHNLTQLLQGVLIIGQLSRKRIRKKEKSSWNTDSAGVSAACIGACETLSKSCLSASLFCPHNSRKYQFKRVKLSISQKKKKCQQTVRPCDIHLSSFLSIWTQLLNNPAWEHSWSSINLWTAAPAPLSSFIHFS